MNDAELWVFLDAGESYIDLGREARYDFGETNLYVDFDNTWVALDGEIACFFSTDFEYEYKNNWYNCGVVPVLYDDKEAELVLVWDNENPDGYVAGWRYIYMGFGSQKGLFELADGMYFDLLCDYYAYDNRITMRRCFMRKICIISLTVLLLLASCGKSKTALSADEFQSQMEEAGYTVVDASVQFSDDDTIEAVMLATNEDDDYRIEFYIVSDESQAVKSFNGVKGNFESEKGNSSTDSSVSVSNYSKYTQTTNDKFQG